MKSLEWFIVLIALAMSLAINVHVTIEAFGRGDDYTGQIMMAPSGFLILCLIAFLRGSIAGRIK